jgi:hypothetical protein
MRAVEKQSGESPQAWEAFKIYRDLGQGRSIDRAYQIYLGHHGSTKRASGRFKGWSVKHDWVDRAQAWDDYLELVRRKAVEDYERSTGTNSARKSLRVQEELLEVKGQLVKKLRQMAEWPLERVVTESDDEGNVTHVHHPARWSFHTLVKAIEVLDDSPDKIAFTNPSGTSEYGQNPDDIRQLFAEILEAEWQDDGEDREE